MIKELDWDKQDSMLKTNDKNLKLPSRPPDINPQKIND